MAATFSLVHISDLHLSTVANAIGLLDTDRRLLFPWIGNVCANYAKGVRRHLLGTYSEQTLAALSDALEERKNERGDDFDLYVVTGDLATIGEADDLLVAKNYFEGKILLASDTTSPNLDEYVSAFQFDASRLVLIPGNHDRYNGGFLLPGGNHFEDEELFGTGWELAKGTTLQKGSRVRVSEITRSGERLFVISADFSHRAPRVRYREWWKPWYWLPCSWLGRGTVDRETLDFLCEATRECSKQGAVIWAMHYMPLQSGDRWSLGLYGGSSLLQMAIKHGVQYILSGHTHIASPDRDFRSSDPNQRVRIIGAGSACARVRNTENMFYDLTVEVSNGTISDVGLFCNEAKEDGNGDITFQRRTEDLF